MSALGSVQFLGPKHLPSGCASLQAEGRSKQKGQDLAFRGHEYQVSYAPPP